MVGFLHFLGVLSIVGGFVGVIEFAQIQSQFGSRMELDPFLAASFLASALIGFGIFWGFAEIISYLKKINENLKEGD